MSVKLPFLINARLRNTVMVTTTKILLLACLMMTIVSVSTQQQTENISARLILVHSATIVSRVKIYCMQ